MKRSFNADSDDDFKIGKENWENRPRSAQGKLRTGEPKTPVVVSKFQPQSLPAIPLKDISNLKLVPPTSKKDKPEKRSRKTVKTADEFKFEETSDCCQKIVQTIKLSDCAAGPFRSPLDIFRYLENGGYLSEQNLQVFANYDKITSINFAPSYAPTLNDVNLLVMKPLPASRCTIPLFKGFQSLKVVDLTNVPIRDEELRYLITLRLEAMGLSGTGITDKGLRYLVKHAKMVDTLACIKVCYVQHLSDKCVAILKGFPRLDDVDFLGVNLEVSVVPSFFNAKNQLVWKSVRLPSHLFVYLRDRHVEFIGDAELMQITANNDAAIDSFQKPELHRLLKKLRAIYADVYLNLELDEGRTELRRLLHRRKQEEILWRAL